MSLGVLFAVFSARPVSAIANTLARNARVGTVYLLDTAANVFDLSLRFACPTTVASLSRFSFWRHVVSIGYGSGLPALFAAKLAEARRIISLASSLVIGLALVAMHACVDFSRLDAL